MNQPQTKSKKEKRWRLLADTRVQGQFCLRVVVYWMICQFSLLATMAMFAFLSGESGNTLYKLVLPGVVVSLMFLPIAMLDMLKLSNRLVGPMINLRRHLSRLQEPATAPKFVLRDGDFYSEISDLVADLQACLNPRNSDPVGTPSQEDSSPTPTGQSNEFANNV